MYSSVCVLISAPSLPRPPFLLCCGRSVAQSCVFDSLQPHGLQHDRPPFPHHLPKFAPFSFGNLSFIFYVYESISI